MGRASHPDRRCSRSIFLQLLITEPEPSLSAPFEFSLNSPLGGEAWLGQQIVKIVALVAEIASHHRAVIGAF